ncbi:MAG: PrsW family intramembrane metalloprotease [Myxococcota bacterium]|jgi:RsiW-degrading membrane proteinase PrsW (M82 family)|nr:PrsW family intramembrane metalloprotease [Myxococcota bacterium]
MSSQIILLLAVTASALPALLYLFLVWRLDRYEPEPIWLVGATFAYGATMGIAVGVFGTLVLLAVLGGGLELSESSFAGMALFAPLAEEPGKGLVLLLLLLGKNFDNTTDGLIYGSAAGLGFAMTENFFYFLEPLQRGDMDVWLELVLIRGAFTALMHCCASAALGAMLGAFRYRGFVLQWLVAPFLGLAIAIAIHATFNGLLVLAVSSGSEHYAHFALALVPILVIALLIVTKLSLLREQRLIRRELADEVHAGVLLPEHASIIPDAKRRKQPHWLPPHVDRAEYVKTATLLAFRRHQARLRKLPTGSQNPEIHALRMRLYSLVNALPTGAV